VVVLRNSVHGLETLMLRKNSKISFGGMWVFPGGRVDHPDRQDSNGTHLDEVTAARHAAAREALEEAAITVDPQSMILFAYWYPPEMLTKRYSTWFFAAQVQDRSTRNSAVQIDQGEIVEGEWMTPQDCLQRHKDGAIELAAPTWVTLARLGGHRSAQEALQYLKSSPPRYHVTRLVYSERGPIALWSGDAGYENKDAAASGARHRLEMFSGGYRYLDTLNQPSQSD